MHTTTHWPLAVLTTVILAATGATSAFAGHPSTTKWSTERPSGAVAGCLSFTVTEDDTGVLEIKNMCRNTFTIDSGSCEPAICKFETIEIPAGAKKGVGPHSFDIAADELNEGESVKVTVQSTLGDTDNPEMVLTFTLESHNEASHDMGDATGDTGGDATDRTDAGADTSDDGASQSTTDSGGCSAPGPGTPTPLLPAAAFLLVGLFARRRQ